MAYVKIHAITRTPSKALSYIENPEKTDYQMLVDGYHVEPLSASVEFALTRAQAKHVKGDYTKTDGAENLAYHMVQSFAPWDKITPEEAHKIGQEWADKVLGGKYEYVIATHVDKGHIHNHIIFNAVSYLDFRKWNNYKVIGKLRKASDELCAEHGLHIIGKTWKEKLKVLIDQAIKESQDFESFVGNLNAHGVEVKQGARLSFRLTEAGQTRFTRGDQIGAKYSWEGIREQLGDKNQVTITRKSRWQRKGEIQALANAINTIYAEHITQEGDFATRLSTLLDRIEQTESDISGMEEKIGQYQTAAKYLLAAQNPMIDPATGQYVREQLNKMGVNPAVDPQRVNDLITEKQSKVEGLKQELKKIKGRIKALQRTQKLTVDVLRPQTWPER